MMRMMRKAQANCNQLYYQSTGTGNFDNVDYYSVVVVAAANDEIDAIEALDERLRLGPQNQGDDLMTSEYSMLYVSYSNVLADKILCLRMTFWPSFTSIYETILLLLLLNLSTTFFIN